MIIWALKYLKEGFIPIPLKAGTKDQPLIEWKQFQTRKPTEIEIRTWWNKWPNANIAGLTGKLADKIVVDVELEGLKEATKQNWGSPLTVRTSRGKHFWMKYPENGIRNKAAFNEIKGLDLRGDGGYALLPPSLHPSGKRYQWQRQVYKAPLPEIPKEFLIESAEPRKTKPEGWIAEALNRMTLGNIDDTLVSILGRMRRDGWNSDDALAILEPVAISKGATPGHVEDKIKNIWSRYESKASVSISRSNEATYAQSSELSIHSPADDDSFNKFSAGLERHEISNGLKTGFPTLDRFCEGGLKSERLFTLAARTGTGKTNFAIALSRNLCEAGKKVLFFSTEFQYAKIWSRLIGSGVRPEEFRKFQFFVCDGFAPNINQVEEAIKRIIPDVFIFDHINHIGEERESIGAFMQGCNFLQRKYASQGIMVAQLNRQADWVEDGKRIEPRMSMIKGSGTIEQASSRVLLLSEVRVAPEYNEIIGVLDKNDSGDRGIIQFGLYKSPYHFKELA